jgi:hypothetical protein
MPSCPQRIEVTDFQSPDLARIAPALTAPVWKAWQNLNVDCAKRDSPSIYDRCSLCAPQLSGLFG